MKNSFFILAVFGAGIISGKVFAFPPQLSMFTLYMLIFFVGLNMGANVESFQQIGRQSLLLTRLCIGSVSGAVIGAFLFSFFHYLSFKESLSVGFGFGYYSLSSLIIENLGYRELAAVALIANILRELLTLTLARLIARFYGPYALIQCGGATSMDTTLPMITKYAGQEWALVSFVHGVILTMCVPFLVALVLKAG